jgi:phage baseplate assembly protein W
MAEINLNILTQDQPQKADKVIFNDIRLDLVLGYTNNDPLVKGKEVRDIIDDVNVDAIQNAFINLITTSPGEKPLNPTFGINFGDLLFLPVTEERADVIGTGIIDTVAANEPRVNIINLTITPDIENHSYICNFTYSIPRFAGAKFNLSGNLSRSGFSV